MTIIKLIVDIRSTFKAYIIIRTVLKRACLSKSNL